jgi:hypothetical protein
VPVARTTHVLSTRSGSDSAPPESLFCLGSSATEKHLNCTTRTRAELPKLVWLERTAGHHSHELDDHPGPPRRIECVCELAVSVPQQAVNGEISAVMTPRFICTDKFHFLENAFAEPLKSAFSEFAKHLPVRFREILHHEWIGTTSIKRTDLSRHGSPSGYYSSARTLVLHVEFGFGGSGRSGRSR